MSTKRLTVDVPTELYEKFKIFCIGNHSNIKDEINRFICSIFEGVEKTPLVAEGAEQKKASPLDEIDHHVIDNLFGEVKPITVREAISEEIEAKLEPICEKIEKKEAVSKADLESLQESLQASFREDLGWLVGWKAEIDHKFAVAGRLIESVMDAVEKTTSAKKCKDDIEGIRFLKGER